MPCFFAASLVICYAIEKFYGYEMATLADEIFFFTDERGYANIVAFQRCAKIDDVDAFKSTLMQRALKFRRLRS